MSAAKKTTPSARATRKTPAKPRAAAASAPKASAKPRARAKTAPRPPTARRSRAKAAPKASEVVDGPEGQDEAPFVLPEGCGLTPPAMPRGALEVWAALAPPLEADGRLVAGDELAFADLCRIRARINALYNEGLDTGSLIDGGSGTKKKTQRRVELKVLEDLQKMAHRLENRFGMTPLARKQLGIKLRRASSTASIRAGLAGKG